MSTRLSALPLRMNVAVILAVSVATLLASGTIAALVNVQDAGAVLASIRLDPSDGTAGSKVVVKGSGFAPSSGGTITFGPVGVGGFQVDLLGSFKASFIVPSVPPGKVRVTATAGLLSASKTFTVASSATTTTASTTSTVSPTSSTTSTSTTTTKPATTTTTTPVGTPSVLFGVSTPSGPYNLAELDQFEADAGKKVGLVMYFQGWAYDEFRPELASAVAARRAIPEVTWEPWDYKLGLNQPDYSLARLIDGTHDAYITRWAQGAKAYGQTLFVRFAHEMNAKHYPWAEGVNGNYTAGQFVTAWRHVVGIFRSVGATNVRWVWSPNVSYEGTTPLSGLYPGDDWVDWVAMDGYNGGTELPYGGFLSFQSIFGPTVNEIASITTSKPLMIGETASVEGGGSKADWITAKFAQLAAWPQIKAFVWFNHNKEADWRIESSESARQSFAKGVADSRYG